MVAVMLLIFFAVIVLVSYPFFRRRMAKIPAEDPSSNKKTEILKRKESSYAAINELEMDRHMGKLSESDYQELYDRYKAEALAAIQEQQQRDSDLFWETALENEIGKKRRGLKVEEAAKTAVTTISCPACSEENEPEASYCRFCGEELSSVCRACNSANLPDSRFCRNCGQSLGSFCPSCGDVLEMGMESCPRCGREIKEVSE